MNPVALQLANGNAFFIGIGLVIVALILRFWFSGRITSLALRIGFITGITLVILSSTPLSFWLYLLWFGFCVAAALIIFNGHSPLQRKVTMFVSVSLISLIMCLAEFPYHRSPVITLSPNESVYIIGDSISAGIRRERTWPDVLGDISHLKVTNLAVPGATVESALGQSVSVTESNSLIFVEIGGNDLLGSTDRKTFFAQLDKLLGGLKERNSQIVMFELPLLPFCNGFGDAQRNLAKKYNVILIPKHFLTDVFALPGGTLDGLHLSQKGHDALANSISNLLKMN
jgi:lysophospholipase L1-like esterase